MKKIIKYSGFLILSLLSFKVMMAQDIILLKTGDEIKSKVTEITSDQVKYKKYDNLNGPTYSYGKNEVFKITYENGKIDVMKSSEKVIEEKNKTQENNINTNNNTSTQTEIDTLTNEKIIALSKIGLAPSVIVNKIQTSLTYFKVSTNDLINLSNKGVSPDVINEMMKAVKTQQTNSENQSNSKDPYAMHAVGIYIYNSEDKEDPLKKVDAFGVNYHISSGGYGGFGGSSTSAQLSGNESNLEIKNSSPVFYFYFDNNINGTSDWYASSSPKEFFLIKLTVITKKDVRSFNVGGSSSGMFSSSSHSVIPEKIKVPFDYTKVNEGIYKVTSKVPLEPGEYCFVFANNTYKVFDFGISVGTDK